MGSKYVTVGSAWGRIGLRSNRSPVDARRQSQGKRPFTLWE